MKLSNYSNKKIEYNKPNNKKVYLEILRIICIFFVMFNHTVPNGYLAFIGEKNVFLYYFYMFFSILCKVAVPIFFMISGALLLGKDEPLKVLFMKRILRMITILVVFSVPYYLWLSFDSPKSVYGFFCTIYTNVSTSAFWYLYVYIGFLIMLPFLRSMVKNLKERDYKYLFWVQVLFNLFLTVIDKFVFVEGRNDFIAIAVALEINIFYPLMGYYIDKVFDKTKFNNKNYIISSLVSFVCIIVTCIVSEIYFVVNNISTSDYSVMESCFGILISVPSITLFYILKGKIDIKPTSRGARIICLLGSSVFGLYLIEKVCRALVSPVYSFLNPYLGGFLSSIALVLSGMVLGFSVICTIKNIPYLKKFVNKFI